MLSPKSLPGRSDGAPIQVDEYDDERLIAMWLHGKTSNTKDAYFRDVLLFTGFVDKPLALVGLSDFQSFADSLSGYKPATKARRLSAVKSLLSFAHRVGYLQVNVGVVTKTPPVKNTLAEKILEEHDVLTLIAEEPDERNQLLLDFLYKTGARVSEACGLVWGDVRERKGSLQVALFGKGGHTRVVLLPPSCSAKLRSFRRDKTNKDPVFPGRGNRPLHRSQVYRIVRAAATRCGIKAAVSPHWLRHAHASHSLDNGAPVHLVQQTLGHASLSTTGKYAHARPRDSSALYLADGP